MKSDADKLRAHLELSVPVQAMGSLDQYANMHRAFVELARGVESVMKVHPPPWEVSSQRSRHSMVVTDGTGTIVRSVAFPSQAVRIADDFNNAVRVVEAVRTLLPWRTEPHG